MQGLVVRSTGSWYTVRTESGALECRLPGRFRQHIHEISNPLAVGDLVRIEQSGNDWMIEVIYPRRNYLIRKASRLDKQFQIVASNLDLAMLVATIHSPRTSTGFIDRFLVSCFSFDIEPSILINKTDLYDEDDFLQLEKWLKVYRALGIEVMPISLRNEESLEIIENRIRGKTTLVFGHSGVGKSTLINSLTGSTTQRVEEISRQHKRGKHTTTYAECFTLGDSTYIIDTPGIREFGLAQMEAWELSHFCPDFEPHRLRCAFNTCLHLQEPGCGVRDAVVQGQIEEFRYINYMRMLEADFGVNLPRIPPFPG